MLERSTKGLTSRLQRVPLDFRDLDGDDRIHHFWIRPTILINELLFVYAMVFQRVHVYTCGWCTEQKKLSTIIRFNGFVEDRSGPFTIGLTVLRIYSRFEIFGDDHTDRLVFPSSSRRSRPKFDRRIFDTRHLRSRPIWQ